jgi:EAL domain-containing protein (putative c-di-GMP-specific phosphodiesterase class I)
VLHASGGISFATQDEDPTEAIRRADVALYVAKDAGKGSIRWFDPGMLTDLERRVGIETDLRVAVERHQIEVHYQPTVSTATGRVTGVEALVRWRHPEHGLLPPSAFIPEAETTGQILAVGRHVLETACRQSKAWQQLPGLEQLAVAVNVSASQLHDPAIIDHVVDALRRSGLEPCSLTIEVTESVMADPDVVARVHSLKALGVRVALDDFGTGYSSLSYLQRLPIDILKIDKSFVDDLGSRADSAMLAEAIVRLGLSLGLETVAEGVERTDQLRILTAAGCDTVQGYLFARPQPPAEIEARLLELTIDAAGSLPSEPDGLVAVEVGPLDANAAREWLQHAHWAIDELEAGRLSTAPVPSSVVAIMRDYLRRWTLLAMDGETFVWSAREDGDVLGLLMRHWLPVSAALAEASRRGGPTISARAGQFSEAMAHALLNALADDHLGKVGTNAGALARAWTIHASEPAVPDPDPNRV